jgi:class 3 adenylate cyclase
LPSVGEESSAEEGGHWEGGGGEEDFLTDLFSPTWEQEREYQRCTTVWTRQTFGTCLLLFICQSVVFLPFMNIHSHELSADVCSHSHKRGDDVLRSSHFEQVYSYWFMPSLCVYALLAGSSAVWSCRSNGGSDSLWFNGFFILLIGFALVELSVLNGYIVNILSLFIVLINAQSIAIRYGCTASTLLTAVLLAYLPLRAAVGKGAAGDDEADAFTSVIVLMLREVLPAALPLLLYSYVNEVRHRVLHLKSRALYSHLLLLEQEIDNVEFVLEKTIPDFILNLIRENPQAALTAYGSVLFADLKGSTSFASKSTPTRLAEVLHYMFGQFDLIATQREVIKIKTLGDCYVACTGIFVPCADHCPLLCAMACGMHQVMTDLNKKFKLELSIRVGIHSGDMMGGIVGKIKSGLDLWSSDVEIANKMEENGIEWRTNLSKQAYELAYKSPMFTGDEQGYSVVAFEKREDDDSKTHVKDGKCEIDGQSIQMYLIRQTTQLESRFALRETDRSPLMKRRSISGSNRSPMMQKRRSVSNRALKQGAASGSRMTLNHHSGHNLTSHTSSDRSSNSPLTSGGRMVKVRECENERWCRGERVVN